MSLVYYARYSSLIGEILIASTENGICKLALSQDEGEFAQSLSKEFDAKPVRDEKRFRKVREMLDSYFEGKSVEFNLPFDLRGTDFQRSVWAEISKIGYGKTVSYGSIAKAVGRPKASRAVGNAVGSNPIPLIIPCHRVIHSDGTLGGFGGGLPLKRRLLKLEKVSPLPQTE